jgi:tRNA threonylcarbamoyladenosine biosynthesis protein TsaE
VLYHIDLYRLESAEEIETLGLDELLAGRAVVVVEWGGRLPAPYRRHAITVRLTDLGEGSRRIEILPVSPAGRGGSA